VNGSNSHTPGVRGVQAASAARVRQTPDIGEVWRVLPAAASEAARVFAANDRIVRTSQIRCCYPITKPSAREGPSEQLVTEGVRGGVDAAASADLRVGAGDVMLDRTHAEDELVSDLAVAVPSRDQPEDLDLAR
jgi:hypothetical protein